MIYNKTKTVNCFLEMKYDEAGATKRDVLIVRLASSASAEEVVRSKNIYRVNFSFRSE